MPAAPVAPSPACPQRAPCCAETLLPASPPQLACGGVGTAGRLPTLCAGPRRRWELCPRPGPFPGPQTAPADGTVLFCWFPVLGGLVPTGGHVPEGSVPRAFGVGHRGGPAGAACSLCPGDVASRLFVPPLCFRPEGADGDSPGSCFRRRRIWPGRGSCFLSPVRCRLPDGPITRVSVSFPSRTPTGDSRVFSVDVAENVTQCSCYVEGSLFRTRSQDRFHRGLGTKPANKPAGRFRRGSLSRDPAPAAGTGAGLPTRFAPAPPSPAPGCPGLQGAGRRGRGGLRLRFAASCALTPQPRRPGSVPWCHHRGGGDSGQGTFP